MSLEVRTVTVCSHVCERDGWTQKKKDRKRDCLSTVAGNGIRRTDMWRDREREKEIESERRERASVRASRPIVTLYSTRLGMCLRPNEAVITQKSSGQHAHVIIPSNASLPSTSRATMQF